MDTIFDAIVVGSGFGGSVMAYRLAQAGYKVCLLERGQAYRPGSFPRNPHQARSNLWDPSEGLHGLFDIWSFQGLDAVVSSGLGGGSLIYASVLKRRPSEWFRDDPWPVTYEELEPHYTKVERMLGATPYPFGEEPYNTTRKTINFRDAVTAAKRSFPRATIGLESAKLAVSFGKRTPTTVTGEVIDDGSNNMHHAPRLSCRLCGECDIGCNYGSKNTLDLTYLSIAKRTGNVTIRTRCEVKTFDPEPTPDGYRYLVSYVDHGDSGKKHQICGTQLILAAGTLGTTYLMLRAHEEGRLFLTKQRGKNFSGNGDLLTFAWKRYSGAGPHTESHAVDNSSGPVITTTASFLNGTSGAGSGMFIQDGGYPSFLNWLLHFGTIPLSLHRILWYRWREIGKLIWHLLHHKGDPNLSAEVGKLLGAFDFFHELIPLLSMGRDIPSGRFMLTHDRRGAIRRALDRVLEPIRKALGRPSKKCDDTWLELDWDQRGSKQHFSDVRKATKQIAHEMGGCHIDFGRVATAHPLGGCPMGASPAEGVVDKNGEVFGYPGLFIADGSVIPSAVGPNPALTIAALSSLFAEQVIANLKAIHRSKRATAAQPEDVSWRVGMRGRPDPVEVLEAPSITSDVPVEIR